MEAKEIQEIFDSPIVKRIECIIIGARWYYSRVYGMNIGGDTIRYLLNTRQCILNSLFVLDEHNLDLLKGFNESLKKQVIEARKHCLTMLDASDSRVMLDCEVQGDIFISRNYPKDYPVQSNRAKKMWEILWENMNREHMREIYFDKSRVLTENQLLYYDGYDLPKDRFDEIERDIRKYIKTTEQFHDYCRYYSLFDLLWVRDFKTVINVKTEYQTYEEDRSYSCDWNKQDYFD